MLQIIVIFHPGDTRENPSPMPGDFIAYFLHINQIFNYNCAMSGCMIAFVLSLLKKNRPCRMYFLFPFQRWTAANSDGVTSAELTEYVIRQLLCCAHAHAAKGLADIATHVSHSVALPSFLWEMHSAPVKTDGSSQYSAWTYLGF